VTFDLRYHDTDVDSSHKVYGDRDGRKIFKERVVFACRRASETARRAAGAGIAGRFTFDRDGAYQYHG